MNKLYERIEHITEELERRGVTRPEVGLVLGSGLGRLAEEIQEPIIIPYDDLPNFPQTTVAGHHGQFVYGTLGGKKVLVQQGRFHFYEGYEAEDVTLTIRVFKALGIHSVIITNAAGGVNSSYHPGDLMLITDQINYTGYNPLVGPNDERLGVRFPDMSQAFDSEYQELAQTVSQKLEIQLQEGIYMGFSGPTYETPAEVRMSRLLGADAVGMSTVPEVIVARHSELRVLGISCITNYAAGMGESLSHEDVIDTSKQAYEKFRALVLSCLEEM